MTAAEPLDDDFGDLEELFPDELIPVDPKYAGRPLHHVWWNIPRDDAVRAWVTKLLSSTADEKMCEAMEWAVNKHAGRGGREGQLSGTELVIGRDHDGHRGLATAIDLLWSIRAKEARGFERMLEGARAKVLQNNRGRKPKLPCTCDQPKRAPLTAITYEPPIDSIGGEPEKCPVSDINQDLGRFLLPDEFWASTTPLGRIYAASMSRLCSPDAVLHAVLSILASLLHHGSRVHTGVRPSALAHYTAVIAESGGGKTEALDCAKSLTASWQKARWAVTAEEYPNEPGYVMVPLGSGEGLLDSFMSEQLVPTPGTADEDGKGQKYSKQWVMVRHNVLAYKGEGREILQVDSRTGSTIMSVLCDAWSGDIVGQANAKSGGRRRILEAGSFTLGVLIGLQVAKAEPLFEDAAGGAPQRFTFAPAEYPPHADDVEADIPDWPGELDETIHTGAITVNIVGEARRDVLRHRRAKAGGRSGESELDGHKMLLRCRVAALLTLLHADTVTTDTIDVPQEMWDLAGMVIARSCLLRDWLADQGRVRRAAIANETDKRRRNVQVQAAHEVNHVEEVKRAASSVVRAVERLGGRAPRGKARKGIRSDLRHHADAAIALAVKDGRLLEEDEGKFLVLADTAEE